MRAETLTLALDALEDERDTIKAYIVDWFEEHTGVSGKENELARIEAAIADLEAERAAPQAGPAVMPDDVAETLRVALEYYLFEMEHALVYNEATDKSRMGDTEAIAAHNVALAWLTLQPRPATDA